MPEIARLSTAQADFGERLARLTAFDSTLGEEVERTVAAILADVRARGDAAGLEDTERLGGVKGAGVAELELPRRELERARSGLGRGQREGLDKAAARI